MLAPHEYINTSVSTVHGRFAIAFRDGRTFEHRFECLLTEEQLAVACSTLLSSVSTEITRNASLPQAEREASAKKHLAAEGHKLLRLMFSVQDADRLARFLRPARLLLVSGDTLQAVPWELLYFAHGPDHEKWHLCEHVEVSRTPAYTPTVLDLLTRSPASSTAVPVDAIIVIRTTRIRDHSPEGWPQHAFYCDHSFPDAESVLDRIIQSSAVCIACHCDTRQGALQLDGPTGTFLLDANHIEIGIVPKRQLVAVFSCEASAVGLSSTLAGFGGGSVFAPCTSIGPEDARRLCDQIVATMRGAIRERLALDVISALRTVKPWGLLMRLHGPWDTSFVWSN